MKEHPWYSVRKELGYRPLVEGFVGGGRELYAERYIFQAVERTTSPLPIACLMTQLGGGRVSEGDDDHERSESFPSQSLLVPAGMRNHWVYRGPVDFAVFFFANVSYGPVKALADIARLRKEPMQFNDTFVVATAQLLVAELQKGHFADQGFMSRLTDVMLEQTVHTLTLPRLMKISPRHAHYSLLQGVLNLINERLTEDWSIESLARYAGVSHAHFRRIFEEAIGMPVHRYIVNARVERARVLLAMSTLPLSQIALECGFGSQSYLTTVFAATHGVTPGRYRNRMEGKSLGRQEID